MICETLNVHTHRLIKTGFAMTCSKQVVFKSFLLSGLFIEGLEYRKPAKTGVPEPSRWKGSEPCSPPSHPPLTHTNMARGGMMPKMPLWRIT